MFISRIKLVNWKNFHECDVALTVRSFVIGANASGKSNFLDAFRFLKDIVKDGGGLQSAVRDRGGVSNIRCLAARQKTDIRIEVDITEDGQDSPKWRYAIDFKQDGGGFIKPRAFIVEETVFNYYEGVSVLDRSEHSQSEDNETLQSTHLEQAASNVAFREVKDVFNNFSYINIVPQLVKGNGSYIGNIDEDDYGRNFLQRISILNENTLNSYLKTINQFLPLAVPQFEDLTFYKDDNGRPHLAARYMNWRAKGSKQEENLFSDGTIRLIGFLFAMLDGRGTVLIEEPESNLHTAVVKMLPAFVAKVQRKKKRQVIITTHSYEILSDEGIDADELIVLKPSSEGTAVLNGKDDENIRAILSSGLTAADATMGMTAPEKTDEIEDIDISEDGKA